MLSKVYAALPPLVEDLDEVLAFIYLEPNVPTEKEFKRTPMLVRRRKVAAALEWLKLNHVDYADLDISYDNLSKYPEDQPPVRVNFTKTMAKSNINPEAAAVTGVNEEGMKASQCPFVVHGLTGTTLEHLGKQHPHQIKLCAIKHFSSGSKVFRIGQAKHAKSLYNNPQLYP